MTQIDSILSLMRNDLNARQLSKLKTVLETILKVRHAPPPLSDLRFLSNYTRIYTEPMFVAFRKKCGSALRLAVNQT